MGDAAPMHPLRGLLVPLVKLALDGGSPAASGWRQDAARAHDAMAGWTPGADDLARDWPAAVALAERDPAVRTDETVNPTLPRISPVTLAALSAQHPDWDIIVAAIRDNASFG
ncbi:hypothetical protein P7D22_01335 [Lichenihabitans sp. Uapishka_5]|uniref:hypothetical protein n=1 Tax=Lichenihabitans sp. Uapishka_5 TaxID=3037302 RepID=UPI0029E7F344|nr:hypothetical protein [Lichenihabitans sp. Uapishka_5]MDX7949817.1 hypothetical protein [Lichenihabitans sp. Uapishka_5]